MKVVTHSVHELRASDIVPEITSIRGSIDALEGALLEIDAAIALVVAGVAARVTLTCFESAEDAAFVGAAWAQEAGLAFRVRRDPPDSVSLVVGPRVRPGLEPVDAESGP